MLPAAQPHHLCCPVQSLDAASAAAGMAAPSSASDAGYMRVLLFARKMQTIRAVFTPPDAAASTRHGGRHGGGPDPADFRTSTQPLAESQAAMDFSNTRWSGRGSDLTSARHRA